MESTIEIIRIPRTQTLDPIIAFLEDSGPGMGRLIVACYSAGWVAGWGAMGARSVRQFVMESHTGYLVNCLLQGVRQREEGDYEYVARIVDTLLHYLGKPTS